MMYELYSLLTINYTLRLVIIGTGLLGITSGALGTFVLLRRQSLLGDAISHAALPGIALAFLITHSKNPAVLLCGGALSGGIGAAIIILITRTTTLKKDTALGIILSVFFGFGLVLLTIIQKYPLAHQAALNKFLFGNASTLLPSDLYTMGIISFVVFLCLLLFWKEFTLFIFDTSFAHTIGFQTTLLDCLLTSLTVLTIVVGLQTVGVVLMSTMLIAPAAAARQWTTRLAPMTLLSACFGASASIIGSLISGTINQLPTGPTIVVVISFIVMVSLLCAPRRGVLWNRWHHSQKSKQL